LRLEFNLTYTNCHYYTYFKIYYIAGTNRYSMFQQWFHSQICKAWVHLVLSDFDEKSNFEWSGQRRGNYFWTGGVGGKTGNAKLMGSLSNLDRVFVPEISVL